MRAARACTHFVTLCVHYRVGRDPLPFRSLPGRRAPVFAPLLQQLEACAEGRMPTPQELLGSGAPMEVQKACRALQQSRRELGHTGVGVKRTVDAWLKVRRRLRALHQCKEGGPRGN